MKTLIVSNFRAGSWSLLNSLKDNLISFDEIFFQTDNFIIKNKIKEYSKCKNAIAKLHPIQAYGPEKDRLRLSSELCEVADKIIYIQRKDTLQQVISYAVARKQHKISNEWKRERNYFTGDLNSNELDFAFDRLSRNDKIIHHLYRNYPGKVITLEDDLEYNPYPNKFSYSGNWVLPHNFKLLV